MAKKATRPSVRIPKGYDFVELLHEGPMGVVALVKNQSSGQLDVLKRLPEYLNLFKNPDTDVPAFARFCREFHWMATCSHSRIVKMRESHADTAGAWIVMEYLPTGSLAAWLQNTATPVSLAEALPWTLQILDALHYLHHLPLPDATDSQQAGQTLVGLVHRDIKPSNILFAGDPRTEIKVADFGLTKAYEWAGYSGITASGIAGGTFKYMPRSQAADFLRAGPGVDVWAATAVLFELLSGEVPRDFPAGPPAKFEGDIVVQHEPRPIRSVNPSVPADVASFIDEILRQDENVDGLKAWEVGVQVVELCHCHHIALPSTDFE